MSPNLVTWLLLLLVITTVSAPAKACRCPQTTVYGSYYNSNYVIRGKVIESDNQGSSNDCLIKVETKFKGCPIPATIWVTATTDCGSCCIFLQLGVSYLLPLDSVSNYQSIASCQGIQKYDTLDGDELEYLNTRNVCCGRQCSCVRKNMVNCFIPPCRFATAPCPEAATCINNYCGGCNTDWVTSSGAPACF